MKAPILSAAAVLLVVVAGSALRAAQGTTQGTTQSTAQGTAQGLSLIHI